MAKTFIPYVGPRIVPGHVDAILRGTCFGNMVQNVYGFKYTGTRPTALELKQLGEEFLAALIPVQDDYSVTDLTWVDMVLNDIGVAGGNTYTVVLSPGVHGANTGSDTPLNVSASMETKTSKRGKRFKGRKSYSALPENEVNHNTLSSNIISWLGRIGLLLVRLYVSGKFAPAVASLPKVYPAPRLNDPAESNIITSVSTVDDNSDSASRRLNRRGR
jgi:hypothetical protein